MSKVPGTVIRSPTDSSAPRVLSKARSLLVVIGAGAMNAWTLMAVHVSSELLVTQPLTSTGFAGTPSVYTPSAGCSWKTTLT